MPLDLGSAGLGRSSMAVDSSPIHRLDARIKLVGVLALVLTAALTPPWAWRFLIVEAMLICFLLGVAGIELGRLLRRWLALAASVITFTAAAAWSHPIRADWGFPTIWAYLLARSALAVICLLMLSETSSWVDLLQAARRLGAPRGLLAVLEMMARHLTILSEELDRMILAVRSRSYSTSRWAEVKTLAAMLAHLLMRSIRRGERNHAAMLARGWTGEMPSLETPTRSDPGTTSQGLNTA